MLQVLHIVLSSKNVSLGLRGGSKDSSNRTDKLKLAFMSYEMNCGIVPFCQHLWISSSSCYLCFSENPRDL